MGYREIAVELLYNLLIANLRDGRYYSQAGESSKRLLYKNFFKKLAHQKRSFCRRIKYEIEVLQKEIEAMGGIKIHREIDSIPEVKVSALPVFRTEKDGLIKDCYRREKDKIHLYNTLLSRICVGQIREMLLFQKHSVQLILNEIEAMGLKIYLRQDNEKNEGEKGEKNFK